MRNSRYGSARRCARLSRLYVALLTAFFCAGCMAADDDDDDDSGSAADEEGAKELPEVDRSEVQPRKLSPLPMPGTMAWLEATVFKNKDPLSIGLPEPPKCAHKQKAGGTTGPDKCSATTAGPAFKSVLASAAKRPPGPFLPWTSGGTIAESNGTLVVVDRDNREVVAVDAVSLAPIGKRVLKHRPQQLVVGLGGDVWVAVPDANVVLRSPTAELTKPFVQMAASGRPVAVALAPNGKYLAIAAAASRQLRIVQPWSGKLLATAETLAHPTVITYGMGHIVVGHRGSRVRRFALSHPSGTPSLAAPMSVELRVGGLSRMVQTSTFVADTMFPNADNRPGAVRGMALEPGTNQVWMAHSVVHPGRKAMAVNAANLSGTLAWKFLQQKAPPAPPYYGAHGSLAARPVEPEVTRLGPTAISSLPIESKSGPTAPASAHKDAAAVAVHPKRHVAFVAMSGSNSVLVVRSTPTAPSRHDPVFVLHTGAYPIGLTFNKTGTSLYVHNAADQTISRFDMPTELKTPFKAHVSHACASAEAPYTTSALSPMATAGRYLFTRADNPSMSLFGDLSCTSCHLDGGEDGITWLGSLGLRQTPALAGRLKDTGPFNWAGSAQSLIDNMRMTVHRLAGDGLCATEFEALKAYLLEAFPTPVSPFKSAAGLTNHEEQGRKLFMNPKIGCASCHGGKTLQDGKAWDVGTATETDKLVAASLAKRAVGSYKIVFPELNFGAESSLKAKLYERLLRFNTPSLRGVWATAPYLHDGSAPTLKDALLKTKGKMGHIEHLDDEQLNALVAYLKTL